SLGQPFPTPGAQNKPKDGRLGYRGRVEFWNLSQALYPLYHSGHRDLIPPECPQSPQHLRLFLQAGSIPFLLQPELLPCRQITSQTSLALSGELIGMVAREAPESAQCLCPSLASLNAKDVLRRKHKRKSRQHQRFLARKALLQEHGLRSTPPEPGSSPGTEAASSVGQRPRAESGGAPCSRKPTPRESAGPLPSKCVAIDCEMVGTGPRGRVSELARCSVVSYYGEVLYDKYIQPEMPIVDYRTRWSGITRQHMRKAIPFQVAQKEILKLLKGKVLVGHALHNDFQALKYIHPRGQTRDTTYVGQHGHSSVEDAVTAMELYRLVEVQWEQQEASSLQPHPEDREPDSSTDMEQYMEDQYWPEDPAQGASRGTGEAPGRTEGMHVVAMDCEMVGLGPFKESGLARCSLVDYHGNVLYDKFIRPEGEITDYRTPVSGITPQNMEEATPFAVARL
ncbi:hypothetical protein E2I00_019109, partial [Balaenoptera physalus]